MNWFVCLAVQLAFVQFTDATGDGPKNCPNGCIPDKGEKGYLGFDGQEGPVGQKGRIGLPGRFPEWFHWHVYRGRKGARGEMGQDGVPGEKGEKGTQGSPGMNGDDGNPGFPGSRGDTGIAGPVGEKGSMGPTGTHGPPGAPGVVGMKGNEGAKGDSGDDGLNGEKGDAGSKGEPGSKGDNGIPGAKGVAGMEGDKGFKGAGGGSGGSGGKGHKGIPGIDGENGNQGLKGEKGTPGIKGDKGSPGHAIKGVQQGTEICSADNEGLINYDPVTKELYYCDGSTWQCASAKSCNLKCTYKRDNTTMNEGDVIYKTYRGRRDLNRPAGDIVVLVDDSGTMTTEHAWIKQAALDLEETLIKGNVGVQEPNQYSVVAFGGATTHVVEVNGQKLYSAADLGKAIDTLTRLGDLEDGYEAVEYALQELDLRSLKDPETYALNIILITDEPRARIGRRTSSTGEDILARLQKARARFNLIANIQFQRDLGDTLGVDAFGRVYFGTRKEPYFSVYNSKGFREGNVRVGDRENLWCNSYRDYGLFAMGTRGAVWDLQALRTGQASYARSFSAAVTFVKADEVIMSIHCERCVCKDVGRTDSGDPECTEEDDKYCMCRAEDESRSDEECKTLAELPDVTIAPPLSWDHLLRDCIPPPA